MVIGDFIASLKQLNKSVLQFWVSVSISANLDSKEGSPIYKLGYPTFSLSSSSPLSIDFSSTNLASGEFSYGLTIGEAPAVAMITFYGKSDVSFCPFGFSSTS